MAPIVSYDNPVMKQYAHYAVICLLKMFAVMVFTVRNRFKKTAFANAEDLTGKNRDKHKPNLNDPDVERARRNHLNDLENILPFLFVGFLYVLTGPELSSALLHFRVFTGARICHTLAYQIPIPQPARVLTFGVGLVTTLSMAVQVLLATM